VGYDFASRLADCTARNAARPGAACPTQPCAGRSGGCETMHVAELEALRQTLKQTRRWPEGSP
jgi:hypothetical protein